MRLATVFLALLLPGSLFGQGTRHSLSRPVPDARLPIAPHAQIPPPHNDLELALGGLVGGAAGFVAGGFLGSRVELAGGCDGDDWFCGWSGGILGAAVGTTVMIPAGVHLANGGRGSLGRSLAASGIALAGGVAIAVLADRTEPLILIPIAQIIGAVAIEQRTSQREDPGPSTLHGIP